MPVPTIATSELTTAGGTGAQTRRSARLTEKPAQTDIIAFPQITDAEDSDDGVEFDFRWQEGEL